MDNLKVNNEIGKLKTILLHCPGEELNNLIPKYLGELLFDDIPWLPLAVKEHNAFAEMFRKEGVKVVYLEDLVVEALNTSSEVKKKFIEDFISESEIHSETLREVVCEYLSNMTDTLDMVKKTMSGIKKNELEGYKLRTLSDYVNDYPFVVNPMPNLYFTRDPFVIINNGVSLNKMYSVTRNRETIYGRYIFNYHPKYKNCPKFYLPSNETSIEGGDIHVLSKETLIVGVSQRTTPEAVERLAKNLFFNSNTSYKTVLAFTVPNQRTFMHLDTIFSQVDYDKFTIHNGCYKVLKIYEIVKDPVNYNKLIVTPVEVSLEEELEKYLGKKITLIPCGGADDVSADREQWSDGSNMICISPGKVIGYERNDITNEFLRKFGIEVLTIPSSELSRGRGGPRCMCMPLEREDI